MDLEVLNHTIGQGKVTCKCRHFESAIDYILVNQRARGNVIEMVVDEEGDFDMDTDHNVLMLSYQWGSRAVKGKSSTRDGARTPGRSDFYWKCRNKDFEGFETDLLDLDCLYGSTRPN